MAMEEEEGNTSSEEEEEEEKEDIALDSDMEQVSGGNLATCSAQAIPPPPQEKAQLLHFSEPCSPKVFLPSVTLS